MHKFLYASEVKVGDKVKFINCHKVHIISGVTIKVSHAPLFEFLEYCEIVDEQRGLLINRPKCDGGYLYKRVEFNNDH